MRVSVGRLLPRGESEDERARGVAEAQESEELRADPKRADAAPQRTLLSLL